MQYRPSRLELSSSGRAVVLQFVPPAYELTLRHDADRICERVFLTGADLRQVALDMHPVESQFVRLSYAARHILIEISGKLFARIPDVDFIRLHNAASAGAGESVKLGDGFDLR